MPRIAVISDSHGGRVRLEMFADLARREKFDAIIHCGDGASDAKWLSKNVDCPVHFVAGNCDFFGRDAREFVGSFGNVRMLAVHGDLYDVKWDLTRLSYYAEEKHAQLCLYGHTHQPSIDLVGSALMVNPGALKDGRYAVVKIEDGDFMPSLYTF